MWTVPEWTKWDLSESHQGRCQVDVYSAGEPQAEDVEIVDGTITEKLALGQRSTLSLDVEPSAQWVKWFALPKLELKVWSGISWGRSEYLIPMGVFVVDPPGRTLPASLVTLSGNDRWQLIAQNDLLYKWPGPAGWATQLAARLMAEGGLPDAVIDVSRDLESPGIMWDGKRHDLIRDYLLPIGADAYVDREGRPVIRTRKESPGRDLTHGSAGTLIKISSEVSLSGVYNAVGAASTKTDITLDPAFVMITDPAHPAHESRIGRRQTLVTSNMIENWGDAYNFARSELARLSSPALAWSAECVPDPTRMPGDRSKVTSELGPISAIVQQVTHPLVVDSDSKTQTVVFGATLE